MYHRGAPQGYPTASCLFILALEIIIYFTPNSNLIGRVEISDHHFAYSSYADDKIF